MAPAPADVSRQSQINAGIVALAAAQTAVLWPQVEWDSPAAAAAVRELYGAIVDQFGRSAAAVAAQFYDEQRVKVSTPGHFTATMTDPLPRAMLDKIVDSAFLGASQDEHVLDAKATTSDLPVEQRVPARLDSQLQRLVLQPGRETIALNAATDPVKPRYVRVPQGANTCAFCVMMASRELGIGKGPGKSFGGYHDSAVRFDEQTQRLHAFAKNSSKFHDHCDCEAVPVFPDQIAADVSPKIGDYQDMYYKAAADAGTHSDAKKILASMRTLHGLK
ncbi:MAG: hypothetical protein K2Q25_02390 [Mycobacteriaceae bacterium]|nr:hypothetical protein [Mycobacteriaceae bacterium]